jgi:hypothetical protein
MIYHDTSAGFADVAIGLENASGTQVYNNTIFMENSYPNAIEYRFSGTSGVLSRIMVFHPFREGWDHLISPPGSR